MNRIRSRTRSEPERRELLEKTLNGAPFDSMNTLVRSRTEAMDDVVVPNFRKRIRSGEIINNPCWYDADTVSAPSGGTYRAENASQTYLTSGGNLTDYHQTLAGSPHRGPSQTLPPPDAEGLMKLAKQQAIANIDSTPKKFLEDLFEIRETLRFIRNPIRSLTGLSRNLRSDVRRRQRLGKSLVDAIADSWLTYRFAFSPLVRSTYEAVDVHVNWDNYHRPERRTARGRFSHNDIETDTPRHYWSGSAWDNYSRTREAEREMRAQILYEVTNPVVDAGFKLGLRAKDIPEGIWQILPYSFMVDRVLNITNLVRGITNLLDPNVKIVAASTTDRLRQTTTLSFTDQFNSGWTVTVVPDVWTEEYFDYNRVPWTPTVSDTVPVPTLKQVVKDATHISDLLALVNQRITF